MAAGEAIELLRRSLELDLGGAEIGDVRSMLNDLARVQARIDARRVEARRRLDDLSRNGTPIVPDQEFARASNTTARDANTNSDRDATLTLVPAFEDALRDGDTTGAHVDGLARGLRRLEPADRTRFVADEGARLARLAKRQTPDQFAKTVREAVSLAQADGGIGEFERQRRATYLRTWVDQISGMTHLRGELDPESALKLTGRLRNLVEQLFHDKLPDTCPEDPTLKQDHLRALALVALVDQTTSTSGQDGPGRVDVIVVADEHSLRHGLHQHSLIDTGNPDSILPVETLRRMACYANIIPMVMNSDGVVTDMGRTTRLATRAQRRRLRAMYSSCGVPGCRVAFEQCVIHHIRYWENGGDSDLENMIPLCSKHHHSAHEGGWHLALNPRNRALTITYPDGSIQTTGPPHARAG